MGRFKLKRNQAIAGISENLWFIGGYFLSHSSEELRKNILIISRFLDNDSQMINNKIDKLRIDINDPIEEMIFQDKNESGQSE